MSKHYQLPDNLTVAVLMGGPGNERDVSLQSGANIANALQSAGATVIRADLPTDMQILDDDRVDVFFPIIHGTFGEDGQLQQMLEQRSRIFVGPDSKASALAFNKAKAKDAFRMAGAETAWDLCLYCKADFDDLEQKLLQKGSRFAIKPINEGSSVGVSLVDSAPAAVDCAHECFDSYGDCMIEEFLEGPEITIGIVDQEVLPIIEIRSENAFYDYKAKYLDDTTKFLFDTITDQALVNKIQQTALNCFRELGCRHMSRVDMILSEGVLPYVLEINTLPGFTSHSLLPLAAEKSGMTQPELCARIVNAALNEKKH